MAAKRLLTKIYQTLKSGHFPDESDLVDVSEGDDGGIHIVVVSRKFDGKRYKDKRELIWKDLMAGLTEAEWSQVSLAVARSPEEVKVM
jgi:acid stress-induced BolA-like protein IbaG/YrbA